MTKFYWTEVYEVYTFQYNTLYIVVILAQRQRIVTDLFYDCYKQALKAYFVTSFGWCLSRRVNAEVRPHSRLFCIEMGVQAITDI